MDGIRGATAAKLAWWQTCEGEVSIAGFFQAVGHGSVLEPPLADEGFAARFDLFSRCRIDHSVVVVGDFLMKALRGVREELTVLMHRAPLHRHAIPNAANRPLQARPTVDHETLRAPPAALDALIALTD